MTRERETGREGPKGKRGTRKLPWWREEQGRKREGRDEMTRRIESLP